MPWLLQLQKLPRKGDGGWKKKCLCIIFWLTRSSWKKCVLGHPIAQATSYCLLPDTFWLCASPNAFKVGSVKFTNSLLPPSIVKIEWRKTALEFKAAKGLKRYQAKVKGVNSPAWTAQYLGWGLIKLFNHLLCVCVFSCIITVQQVSISCLYLFQHCLLEDMMQPCGACIGCPPLPWRATLLSYVLFCSLLIFSFCFEKKKFPT